MSGENDYWASARKEAEHEIIMESLGNMAYEEALFKFCRSANMKDCICGHHTFPENGNKPYRVELTGDEDFMVKRHFSEIFNSYIINNSCAECGRMIINQPLTQAKTGNKYHNHCYPTEEEY